MDSVVVDEVPVYPSEIAEDGNDGSKSVPKS